MKRKAGSKHSISYLSHSLKKVGRSVGRKNPAAIARQVASHARIRKHLVKEMGKLIQKEMRRTCEIKNPSFLRGCEVDNMLSFTWSFLIKELGKTAPTLLQLLTDSVARKRRRGHSTKPSHHAKDEAIIGVCAAIMLCHHYQHMNLFQRLVSVLLYSDHVPVQVSNTYNCIHFWF